MTTTFRPQSVRAVFAGVVDSRPAEYRGIAMRSQLEADFAVHLDALGVTWRYEPRIFGARGEGYLPDFEVLGERTGRRCFVEVKPTLAEVPLAQERMEVIWVTHPGALLIVACAQGSTFSAAELGVPWASWQELWKHR